MTKKWKKKRTIMSGHKYTAHSTNLFDDDDIDDERFLANSSRNYQQPQTEKSYREKTRDIEERTLASSNRSLGLLYETENVGIATAEELSRQREQLENTNKHLDDINQTLRFSQKHLNGLKSIFGGLKNYIAGQKDVQQQLPPAQLSQNTNIGINSPSSSFSANHAQSFSKNEAMSGTGGNFNKQLDKNLDEMTGAITRLKGNKLLN